MDQGKGVEWLDDPVVSTGVFGQEHVGLAVEEQKDRPAFESAGAFLLAQCQTGSTATHVADLQIEDHHVGIDLVGGGDHIDAGSHSVDDVRAPDGGLEFVENPIGVGGQKYACHGPDRTRGQDRVHGRASCAAYRYHAHVLEIIIESAEDTGYAVLRPEGELDAYSVAQFREAFSDISDEPRLIVDLAQVQFIDSAGLGALIGGIRKLRENEGRISVFCDRANINRLLHTTGFNRIVPVKESMTEAVASLDEDPS